MTRIKRAIITAADKTSGTFAAIAETIRRMQSAAKSASGAAAYAARIRSTAGIDRGIVIGCAPGSSGTGHR